MLTQQKSARPRRFLLLAGLLASAAPAWAQKNSGPLLPVEPAAPAYRPQPIPRPAPPMFAPPPMPQPQQGGVNPEAERLARTLPLPPETRELRDGVPADRVGTERRLGLREPRGQATDMRGRTPSPREIVDALAPR